MLFLSFSSSFLGAQLTIMEFTYYWIVECTILHFETFQKPTVNSLSVAFYLHQVVG